MQTKKSMMVSLCLCALWATTAGAYSPQFSKAGYFAAEGSPRVVTGMNVGWTFQLGNGAQSRVNLPHTLNVVGFEASGGVNAQGPATYEKHFDFTPHGARQFLHFEAIMGKSQIFLNGEQIGEHFGGYLPIHLEVTGKLKPTGNVLRVWCDNSDNGEIPPGKPQTLLDFAYFGGIYRDCWLVETGAVAISAPGPQEGVYIATHRLEEGKWRVTARVALDGEGTVRRMYEGREVPETFDVDSPAEWTPDAPNLHFLRVEVRTPDGKLSDAVAVRFGFREAVITGEQGLVLNGKPWRKLIGANRHQDFAFVGNAMSNLLHYRDAVKLREAGLTIVRNAHYPQDPAFMDACDEVGLFVIANPPGWQYWSSKPIFGARVLDDIRVLVRRDRSHASLLFWEPILNETGFPKECAEAWTKAVRDEAPLGPKLCACDDNSRGREAYDIIFRHPLTKPNPKDPANGRPTFTREWGDCVDDWSAHNSISRADRTWGEIPQLLQARHYLDSSDAQTQFVMPGVGVLNRQVREPAPAPRYPATCIRMLLEQPPAHFGGALWHSFDHARGYHPDMFFGGIMTSARIPKTSYWMMKAILAKPGPNIPNVDLSPFVHVAHDLTPFSPREIDIYSNVPIENPALFERPLIEIAPYRYTTENGNGFTFYEMKALDRAGRRGRIAVTGQVDGKPFRKPASFRRTGVKLTLDTLRTDLVADGSELVLAIATLTDKDGTPKHLATERIRFSVEGSAEIVNTETGELNPQQTRYGEAVVLLRMGTTPGKVTLTAAVERQGKQVSGQDSVTFETRAPDYPLLYDTPALLNKSERITGQKATSTIDLREVERQQTEFGEKVSP